MALTESQRWEIESKLLEAAYHGVVLANELDNADAARQEEIQKEMATVKMMISSYREALL